MLIVVLCVASCLAYWLSRRLLRRSRQPPTLPGSWPIIGHAHLLLHGTSDDLWDKLLSISNDSLRCGGIGVTSFGPWTLYLITDPEVCATVLNSCLEKDIVYDFWKTWMGNGLFTGPVSLWKPHRKLMLPAFNQRVLENFMDDFNHVSRRLVNKLAERVGKEPFDIFHDLAILGLQNICRTSLGLEDDIDDIVFDDYIEAVNQWQIITNERLSVAWYHIHFVYKWTAGKRRENELVKILHGLSTKIIQDRKAILKANNDVYPKINADKTSEKSNRIVIDILLELNEKGIMSDRQIREEVDTIIFGGHDTSAATLMYCLILIGSYPYVQEKLIAEFLDIFGDSDVDVRKEDLPKLVYLEAVLKESMRLYPFMTFLGRHIDKDLKFKNYTLSAGSRALVLVYGMHRHSTWGPDPELFRPERWLEPGSLPDCPAAFGGFSWGKRSCIGKTYAMMSMKTTLVHLLRKYRFCADHSKMKLKFEAVLKPKEGHHVSIEYR